VREDYSPDGNAWEFFPHDHARSRTYRWGEDGLMGISDEKCLSCFALALWNEADPILKERLFGLTNSEGNHGEDVKEYYFFLDNTPTHSYMKALYKYPQRAFPYADLVATNRRRTRLEPEYELIDTRVFSEDRYFDVFVEYAKVDPQDILIRITATNRGPEAAPLHLLPTLWFRNAWAWDYESQKPVLTAIDDATQESHVRLVQAEHPDLGAYWLACEGTPDLLFTENETNTERLWGIENTSPFVKDGIHEMVVHGVQGKVNPQGSGTKVAVHYPTTIEPGASYTVTLRLSAARHTTPFADTPRILATRLLEANEFYSQLNTVPAQDARLVQRQALAGLLWSKQFYCYDVDRWFQGDPVGPPPPAERSRNSGWLHLNNADIMLTPDTWEYPWYAAWDLAFHCVTMSLIDLEFAKKQLLLVLHEWYMHPNGQLPAYEWALSDVNPPVHAWAAWHIYKYEKQTTGRSDVDFLERVFHKLMLNFNWWVNRKDQGDRNVFQGGFLGLDNIGIFDRNMTLPEGIVLEQSDGTAWMGMFCLTMLSIALELTHSRPVYIDVASKFFEHFLYIADAINGTSGKSIGLWDEEDGFYYDNLCLPDGSHLPLKLRTLVGFIPMLATETIERATIEAFPEVKARLAWLMKHRPYLPLIVAGWQEDPEEEGDAHYLLSLVRGRRLRRLLERMLDPEKFLSDYGIRSLSKYYGEHPYQLETNWGNFTVKYDPAESSTEAFGGNSNWRGPIWFPINFLLVETLRKYHHYYGNKFLIECPTGSGRHMTLEQVANELSHRLTNIFLCDERGYRPVFGTNETFQKDPNWHDHVLFYEYFHGDTGRGVGASHQTGWTALVANLLDLDEKNVVLQREDTMGR
jgi:hypothetical protein